MSMRDRLRRLAFWIVKNTYRGAFCEYFGHRYEPMSVGQVARHSLWRSGARLYCTRCGFVTFWTSSDPPRDLTYWANERSR